MRSSTSLRLLALAVAALPCRATAQSLGFDVDGGSVPGTIDWAVGPGQPFVSGGFIVMSTNRGPLPLLLLDPRDTRSLQVGTDLLSVTLAGPFLGDGFFRAPSLTVPNLPFLIDAPLFLQALSAPGNPLLVDQISEPRTIRFGPAGTWRDRFVAFSSPRSFFPVLPASNGRALIAGGGSGAIFAQIAQKTTEFYDPATDSFSPGPDLSIERSLHTATELADGRWLLLGGVDFRNDPTPTGEIWDPTTEQLTAIAPMRLQRAGHAATLLADGRVLVSGGLTDLNAPVTPIDPIFSTTTTTEIYDPATNTWAPGPNLSVPRAGHLALRRGDGRVLLAGGIGFRRIIVNLPVVQSTTDLFDPNNNTIGGGPGLAGARALGTQIEIGSGRWLLAGGVATISLTQWGTTTTSAEIYDEASNTCAAAASMAQRRGLHVAYPLGGGRFLHIGGSDGSLYAPIPLDSTEIYDATTGRWSPGPTMTRPRAAFGHYRTPTGQICALGGSSGSAGVDNTTEFLFR
ncbi:MAG: hypothetical protein IPM29_29550 [Planctomycetes bacterium]|nr:hypothetical protein [Planctomycetota bacterium]